MQADEPAGDFPAIVRQMRQQGRDPYRSPQVRRVEEIIGERIYARRTELKLTQEQLGERVGDRLGRGWTRQAVSAAEKGKRAFTAAELIAIANVLGTSIGRLLTPEPDVDAVELGTNAYITAPMLATALVPVIAAGKPLDKLQDAIAQLAEHMRGLEGAFGLIGRDLELINEAASETFVHADPADVEAWRAEVEAAGKQEREQ